MIASSQKMESNRREAWGNYWQQGALHSLPTSYAGNYRGAVAAFWQFVASALQPDQRLLDIGTGNGSLPFLFNTMMGADGPLIDAIDMADQLSPAWHQALPDEARGRIVFHEETQAEQLPFADQTFDLVCSQYGIEYADLPAALAEVARVLRPEGRLALVMHHTQSRLAQVAAEELKWSSWLSDEGDFLARARGIYPWLAFVAAGKQAELTNNPEANIAREAFNQAQTGMTQAIESSPVPDLLHDARDMVVSHIDAILSGRATAADVEQASLAWQEALRSGAFRQQELITHALDDASIQRLLDGLKAMGFRIEQADALMEEGDILMGWSLVAHRS